MYLKFMLSSGYDKYVMCFVKNNCTIETFLTDAV